MRRFSFSWKRLPGITQTKQQIARNTGILPTRNGLERKIGDVIIKLIFGKEVRFYRRIEVEPLPGYLLVAKS